jgi:hypothetical protein
MATLSENKSKSIPLNEFIAKFVKLSKKHKSASEALKAAQKRAK